ncbi:MAG: neutral/alkaline non-lysosomal ceramidase N-terminal domain-containing protein [Verrucomicrobiales bacterium]|nr:neutral/alkaline non-lysosomal ceramidase N-terminal domain-containing protein [Verrucomicrobiales bacterium]
MKIPRIAALAPALVFLLFLIAPTESVDGQFHSKRAAEIPVGVASIDITPESPIRLSGYGSRTVPSEGVEQRLFAKAISIGGHTAESPLSILLTVDTIGVPTWVTKKVGQRLSEETGVQRANFALCSTHSHTAPTLHGTLPYMFPSGLSDEEKSMIKTYTDDLIEKLVEVALEACKDPQPARVHWGKGELTFAANRRLLENGTWKGFGVQKDGPVDHSFPLMKFESLQGDLLAVFANYACHCTTLGGDFNRIHGDWAGVAQGEIERRHPGTTALIAIGCGADQNPEPRGKLPMAIAHGKALADEVDRLLAKSLKPLKTSPSGTFREISLPLEEPPARGVWEEQVRKKLKGHHFAEAMLEKLDRGEPLETEVTYPIQTWTFGDDLAMVFLGGEVVVDYAHRFYGEFDSARLWINAYSNDVPCYLPSKRIYGEKGYEVDYSMVYYGKPARLAFDTEDRIADEVLKQIPPSFYSEETKKQFPPPVEKAEALETIRVPEGYEVELFASEPHVFDPVDMAWDRHGNVWVVEMADYPTGVDGKPGGRVRRLLQPTAIPFLGDLPGSPKFLFRESTVFLAGLKFPNSVLPWQDGVLVVTADRILFARDTDGDGGADEQKAIITGFDSGNAQHQLGGLEWGLDGWVHVGNGGSHGALTSTITGQSVELGSRDFRFRPDTGEIELLSGEAQYGLTRDDWGNWFACNNSKPWWHYALADEYLRRNPHVRYPDTKVLLGTEPVAGPVFPTSKTVSRFNDYDAANRFTSACGLNFHRDELPGQEGAGQLFVAEPVHNLVSRLALSPGGATFEGSRLPGEVSSEFFSSTDNWCRPTSIRTGPDGAVYVVDMYRHVIEHPQWIPEIRQRRINLREGHDRGRIYRISSGAEEREPRRPVASIPLEELAAALDDRNGTYRDLIHQELLYRNDKAVATELRELALSASHPEARAQALAALEGLGALDPPTLTTSLTDSHPGVRKHAIKMAGAFPDSEPILNVLTSLTEEANAQVLQQLAYTLGEIPSPRAGKALGEILTNTSDTYIIFAGLSSLPLHTGTVARAAAPHFATLPDSTLEGIFRTAKGVGDEDSLALLLSRVDSLSALARALNAIDLKALAKTGNPELKHALAGLDALFASAGTRLQSDQSTLTEKQDAVRVMGASAKHFDPDIAALISQLKATRPGELQMAAASRLEVLGSDHIPEKVFAIRDQIGSTAWTAFLDATTRRNSWTRKLLEEASTHADIVRAITPTQRIALLHHRDETVREQAEQIFQSDSGSSRAEVLDRFQSSLERKGDIGQGQVHFTTLCSSCHKVEETGFHVGPDLTALTNKSKEALLLGIIDPNAAVEGKYALHVAETTDGQSLSGVLSSETGTSLTLLGAGGLSRSILRNELTSLKNTGLSLMPEGLEAALNEQGMADLLAFLQNTGSGNRVVPDQHGSINLTSQKASASGPMLHHDATTDAFSRITRKDSLTWSVSSLPVGRYAIFFHAGLDAAEIPASDSFQLQFGDETVFGTVEKTGSLRRMRKRQFGEVTVPNAKGETQITFRHELTKGQVSIREIVLIPVR